MESYMRNDIIANYHRIREDILPAKKNTLIFSERERLFQNFTETYPKSDPILKKKILKELKFYFRDRKTLIYALNNSRILHLLLTEILSSNEQIKILSLKTLEIATRENLTKTLLIKNGGLPSLKTLNTSKNPKITHELLRILLNLSKTQKLIPILLEKKFFKLLTKNLQRESKNSFLITLNKILTNFLKFPKITKIALDFNIEDILLRNCYDSSFGVFNQSVYNLLLVSYDSEGRRVVCEKFVYQKIFRLFFKGLVFSENRVERFLDFSGNGSFCEVFDEFENSGVLVSVFFDFFASTALCVEAKQFYQRENAHGFVCGFLKRGLGEEERDFLEKENVNLEKKKKKNFNLKKKNFDIEKNILDVNIKFENNIDSNIIDLSQEKKDSENMIDSEKKNFKDFDFSFVKTIDDTVLLSSILFLTNLAENHVVRNDLLCSLDFFKKLKKKYKGMDLEIFIEDLIEVIEWKP